MRTLQEILPLSNLELDDIWEDGFSAWVVPKSTKDSLEAQVRASRSYGWDHVSVSFEDRTPTWDEMAEIKEMFFRSDETAIQFHPKKDEYVNMHPYCLHIWRSQEYEHKLPPWWLVGLKKGKTGADVEAATLAWEIANLPSRILRPIKAFVSKFLPKASERQS